jgi:phosphatidate cytidylyltransferase
MKGSFLFNFFIIFCLVICSYEWHLMSRKKKYHMPGFFFLILTFYLTYLLFNFKGNFDLFLIVILICISTDLGGYAFGKLFKGPKLTKISPKKTYSGMIGGYLLTVINIFIFINLPFALLSSIKINYDLLIFTLLISTISQIGDIIISYFKRLSNIKDTGNIIPGHGGLLDRVDGMIFAFPISYIILKINIFQFY